MATCMPAIRISRVVTLGKVFIAMLASLHRHTLIAPVGLGLYSGTRSQSSYFDRENEAQISLIRSQIDPGGLFSITEHVSQLPKCARKSEKGPEMYLPPPLPEESLSSKRISFLRTITSASVDSRRRQ